MIVDESYMNELLKYDFTSTKKGRGFTSLLVERKRKKVYDYTANMNTHRQEVPDNFWEPLKPPEGVMDVKLWYNSLSSKDKAAYR